jgi:hypothetical protein
MEEEGLKEKTLKYLGWLTTGCWLIGYTLSDLVGTAAAIGIAAVIWVAGWFYGRLKSKSANDI